jgi:hypothetical protein
MTPADPAERSAYRRAVGVLGPVALTLLTVALVWGHRVEPRRAKAAVGLSAPIGWMITPMTSVGFAASPTVTTPTASVARFSVWLLPLVATVVVVARLREVTVARIGGLHGP